MRGSEAGLVGLRPARRSKSASFSGQSKCTKVFLATLKRRATAAKRPPHRQLHVLPGLAQAPPGFQLTGEVVDRRGQLVVGVEDRLHHGISAQSMQKRTIKCL